jgi:hypothetical protein
LTEEADDAPLDGVHQSEIGDNPRERTTPMAFIDGRLRRTSKLNPAKTRPS